jgi:hypothetical protein
MVALRLYARLFQVPGGDGGRGGGGDYQGLKEAHRGPNLRGKNLGHHDLQRHGRRTEGEKG